MFIQLLLPGWYWLVRQLIKQAALLSSMCIWGILKDRKVVLIRTCSFHLFYFLILFSFLTIPTHILLLFQNFSPLCMIPKPQMLWKANDPKEDILGSLRQKLLTSEKSTSFNVSISSISIQSYSFIT